MERRMIKKPMFVGSDASPTRVSIEVISSPFAKVGYCRLIQACRPPVDRGLLSETSIDSQHSRDLRLLVRKVLVHDVRPAPRRIVLTRDENCPQPLIRPSTASLLGSAAISRWMCRTEQWVVLPDIMYCLLLDLLPTRSARHHLESQQMREREESLARREDLLKAGERALHAREATLKSRARRKASVFSCLRWA
jgi:hypothetical protein